MKTNTKRQVMNMFFSIAEVAGLLGISQSTIRRYEDRRLLRIRRMDRNGYRLYTLQDVVQASIVLSMQRQSYRSNQILDSIRETSDFSEKATLTRRKIEEVEHRIHELELARSCFLEQERLESLFARLKESPAGYGYYERPSMYLFPITQTIPQMFDHPYFEAVRRNDVIFNRFRFCQLVRDFPRSTDCIQWEPAFSMSCGDDEERRTLSKDSLFLSAANCLMFPFDCEDEDKTGRFFSFVSEALRKESKKVDGIITVMTITWNERKQLLSAFLVPVNPI